MSYKTFGEDQLHSSAAREAYASDGSIYRLKPLRVYCPTDEKSLQNIVRQALIEGHPLTPRGGGTGLAGGAVGNGWIIDCSRLNNIIGFSYDEKYVICQPGIIYRDLNLFLKAATPDGKRPLFFPPDPSSGDSCEIGGMLGNNSSGPRSVKYGLTSHYVEELTIINSRGRTVCLSKLKVNSPKADEFLTIHPEYGEILELLIKNASEIKSAWPRVRKNSAGYNLLQVVNDLEKGIFNLPALYIGSEGTLGIFLNVKLRLCEQPVENLSYRLFFDSMETAGGAVAPLLASDPSALEIVDGSTLDLIDRDKFDIPKQAEAMLLLEYDTNIAERERVLLEMSRNLRLMAAPEKATNEEQKQALWAARRAIVPTLYRHHPTRRPFALIEDASLPVEHLVEFIGWIRQRLESENLVFGLFGHIGDGNLHIRPLLDIHKDEEFELAQRLYDEVYNKMFELDGSSTAEHADGRLRSPLLKRLYGDRVYGIFCRIKEILDSSNLFNPGVILTDREFTNDIDYKKLELVCAACGKCNGYCPAYEIFRREDMSARGWLRMLHRAGISDRSLEDTFQFCLNCKNCTTVCPAGVDIAGEILKFKAANPHHIADSIISLFDNKGLFRAGMKIGAIMQPIAASSLGRSLNSAIGKRSFGWTKETILPQPASKTLRDRHPNLCHSNGQIALFHGCADNYFRNTAGDALIDTFQSLKLDICLPEQDCCGLPMEVYGHRDNMIEKARRNIDNLKSFDAIVFTCASCLHRLADYHELFAERSEYHGKALNLKTKLFDACQFILDQEIELPRTDKKDCVVSYHHPCHLRAAGLEKWPLKLIEKLGYEILHPDRAGRCCGQAGSFGFTHYREGRAIFAAKKMEYERLAAKIIFTSCPSCIAKLQAEMGPEYRACHPIELLNDLINGK